MLVGKIILAAFGVTAHFIHRVIREKIWISWGTKIPPTLWIHLLCAILHVCVRLTIHIIHKMLHIDSLYIDWLIHSLNISFQMFLTNSPCRHQAAAHQTSQARKLRRWATKCRAILHWASVYGWTVWSRAVWLISARPSLPRVSGPVLFLMNLWARMTAQWAVCATLSACLSKVSSHGPPSSRDSWQQKVAMPTLQTHSLDRTASQVQEPSVWSCHSEREYWTVQQRQATSPAPTCPTAARWRKEERRICEWETAC